MDLDTLEVKRGEVRGADVRKTPELFRTSGAQDVEPLSKWKLASAIEKLQTLVDSITNKHS